MESGKLTSESVLELGARAAYVQGSMWLYGLRVA